MQQFDTIKNDLPDHKYKIINTKYKIDNRYPLFKNKPTLIINNPRQHTIDSFINYFNANTVNKQNACDMIFSNNKLNISQSLDCLKTNGHLVLAGYHPKNLPDAQYLGVISTAKLNDDRLTSIKPYSIWLKAGKVELNPELKIIPIKTVNNNQEITFNLIQDGVLIGGTKQRMLEPIMKKSLCTEFVYAGPVYGYAQIALAYVASVLNKKATIFIENMRPRWPLTKFASTFNPKIIEINQPASLKKVQQRAEEYVNKIKKKKGNNYICMVSFGLHEERQVLEDQLKLAIPKSMKINPPKRMWLVAGSATILAVLYKIFPKTFFLVVQVGKKIWPDQLELDRTKLFISDQNFAEIATIQPPYETVGTYDAKLWKFFLEEGQNEDYVWNVGKDVMKTRFDDYIYTSHDQFLKNTIKFPYYRTFIPIADIKQIINNIQNYDYKDHQIQVNHLTKDKIIETTKADYMNYDMIYNIVCDKCIVDRHTKDYFQSNKIKLIQKCINKYRKLTPYFLRKVIPNKTYPQYAIICLTIFQIIDKLGDKYMTFLDISPNIGEMMTMSYILNKKYTCVVDNNAKCDRNQFYNMLDYLNRTIGHRHYIKVYSKLPNNNYNCIITSNINNKMFKLLRKNGYVVVIDEEKQKISEHDIDSKGLSLIKKFIFSSHRLQTFTIVYIFKKV